MTYIKTILKTEREALSIKEKTDKKAKTILEQKKVQLDKELEDFQKNLLVERGEELANQKNRLKKIYTEIIEVGKKQKNKMQTTLNSNKEKSVSFILEKINQNNQ